MAELGAEAAEAAEAVGGAVGCTNPGAAQGGGGLGQQLRILHILQLGGLYLVILRGVPVVPQLQTLMRSYIVTLNNKYLSSTQLRKLTYFFSTVGS